MRYFCYVKLPHPFSPDTLPANVKAALEDVTLLPVHGPEWPSAPNTRVYQGKRIVSFEVHTDEVTFQALLDSHLPQFEIMAYRTEDYFPDPASTEENPLPNRPDYSQKPSKAEILDWMNDVVVTDENGDVVSTERPTELKLNYVAGTGTWIEVP